MPDDTQTETKTAETKVADTKETKETKTETKAEAKVEKAADWRSLPDDWTDRDEISKRLATFNSPAELARSFFNAEKQVSKAIVPLGKNASAEEVARYRKQLHIPEAHTGYHEAVKFEPPAGVDLENDAAKKMVDGFYSAAHAAHLTPAQVKGVMTPFLSMVAEDAKATVAHTKELVDAADQKLRGEWRHEYDANDKKGQLWVSAVAKVHPEITFLLESVKADGVPLGDHPVFRKIAAWHGRQMGEDQLATLTMTDKDVDAGKKSMEDLTAKYNEAMEKGDRKAAAGFYEERKKLSRNLYGQGAR